jgi:hypothetical protein
MGRKLSAYEKDVFRYCNEVLHYVWDPIGVAGSPHARFEYDSYVPGVVSLLFSGASASDIAKHLTQITTESMGLSAGRRRDLKTAELLVEWRKLLQERSPK